MSGSHAPLYALLVVTGGLLVYGVAVHTPVLMAGAAVLMTWVTSRLDGGFRFVPLVLYPAAFIAWLTMLGGEAQMPDVLGVLLVVAGLGFLSLREQEARLASERQRRVVRALEQGSRKLREAQDAGGIIRAGIDILEQLKVAPHLAFVAYRKGTPYILGAHGGYVTLLDRPLSPGDNDSRSVQADHWVAGQVLALLPKTERRHYQVAAVESRASSPLGLLVLARAGSEPFTREDAAVIEAVAQLLGAQLGQGEAIRELREANELTLRALGAALEHRDDDTGGHTLRVVHLSERLARRLGWNEDQVKALRWGAYLHDLGKLAIPDQILHKPGTLSAEERRIIQTHPIRGYDMLQDLHFLPAETLNLVRYHHERWDGSGYPAGLRGRDIPDSARLFTIVDVFDALTNARPYKAAWSQERALTEIRAAAGRQFDPQYVDAFERLLGERDGAQLVK